MSDFFIPLGGGNEIGASAYYLSVDGVHILLDCGARLKGEELYPDYGRLLQELNDYSELDLIIISHGHYDHIGSIAKIASLASNALIIATETTKKLIFTQLLEFGRISRHVESDKIKTERYRMAQSLFERIRVKPVMKPFSIKNCRFMLLPAGHMPGAVMVYIQSRYQSVLYTGDFSVTSMFGMNGMRIPKEIRPETLLINAPNAYQERKVWDRILTSRDDSYKNNAYSRLEETIRKNLQLNQNVYLISRSIPRHLDLFYFLNSAFPETQIYLEAKSQKIADILSDMGHQVYSSNIHIGEIPSEKGCIVVGQEQSRAGCIPVIFDKYSLHATPIETLDLIRQINPGSLYMLHTCPGQDRESLEYPVKTLLPNTRVVQAVNEQKYYLRRAEKMKYDQLYRSVMEEELRVAEHELHQERRGGRRSLNEWAAIYGGLTYPDLHPHDTYEELQKTFVREFDLTYEDYRNFAHSSNLDSNAKREYVLGIVERGITLLKNALDGDREAITGFADFTEHLEARDRNGKLFFIGKCVICFMLLIDPDLQNEKYRPIAFAFGASYCNRVLRKLRDGLLRESGVKRRRKTVRDVLQETENVLSESAKAEGMASGDEYEKLLFKYNNCQASLELVQSMLDELNETIDESAEEAKNTEIASFYIKMNSEAYGHLLDSIELVERRLTTLKENKVKIPAQLLPLTIVFKQLLRFIRESGVKPIDITGRVFTTEAEGLAEFTYIGEPFSHAGEKKEVVVEKPGWKYEDTIISLPTVREKED